MNDPMIMENDVIIEIIRDELTPNRTKREDVKSALLIAKPNEVPNPINPSLQYLHDTQMMRDARRWCATRNQFVHIIRWFSVTDPKTAARLLIGRSDISGKLVGKKLMVTVCHQVHPAHIYEDHQVKGQCYEWLPVQVNGRIVFQQPLTNDLVMHSEQIVCKWKPPGSSAKIQFNDLDAMNSISSTVFRSGRLPSINDELIDLAIDRLSRHRISIPSDDGIDLGWNDQWISDTEQLLAEMGHGVDKTYRVIQE